MAKANLNRHLYEGFDFNDNEATAEADALQDIEKLKKFYEDLPKIEAWLQKLKKRRKLYSSYEITQEGINVNGDVDLSFMGLKNIPFKFNIVAGLFSCSFNQIKSLKNAPNIVRGAFYCASNDISSLEDAPKEVGGSFCCSRNYLTSLKGAPEIVHGTFDCVSNRLVSLEGAPKEVNGNFYCGGNPNLHIKEKPKEIKIKGKFYNSKTN